MILVSFSLLQGVNAAPVQPNGPLMNASGSHQFTFNGQTQTHSCSISYYTNYAGEMDLVSGGQSVSPFGMFNNSIYESGSKIVCKAYLDSYNTYSSITFWYDGDIDYYTNF